MHTHHPVLLLCNYHPANTGRGESSPRPTLLTTAFAHSCCMMMVLIFDVRSDYNNIGVVKDAGGRSSVIMTRVGEEMLTLHFHFLSPSSICSVSLTLW